MNGITGTKPISHSPFPVQIITQGKFHFPETYLHAAFQKVLQNHISLNLNLNAIGNIINECSDPYIENN